MKKEKRPTEDTSLTKTIQNDEILYRSFRAIAKHIQQKDLAYADGFLMATFLYNKDNASILMDMISKFRGEVNKEKPLEDLYIQFYQQIVKSLEEI